MSLCRQNYHEECEAGVNKQINLYFYAEYVMRSISFHFTRDDVGLPVFDYFQSIEQFFANQAQTLAEYQVLRGGRIVFQDIKKPENDEWGTLRDAMQTQLDLTKYVIQGVFDLHGIGAKHDNSHLMHHLSVGHQVSLTDLILQTSKHVTNLTRVGPGLGEYEFAVHLARAVEAPGSPR